MTGKFANKEPRASRPYMPGYGIADAASGQGLLPWSWAVQVLENARRYWLATVRPDGAPHMMPIWGVWLEESFRFMTGPKSRKARNLAINPRCVISPERADKVLVLEGIAEIIIGSVAVRRFKNVYSKKYDFDMEPYNDPLTVIRPRVVFGHIEDFENHGFTQTATRWTFDAV
jgi:hypothetical protein